MPLARVRVREVVGALRHADAHRGDGDPAAVEDLEELVKPWPRTPRRLPAGTTQSVNESDRVSDAFQPIFRSGAEIS